MIAALVAATLATSSCSGSVGDPVAIRFAPLPIETLGGSYKGGRTSGGVRVDRLRYDWGVLLQSDDPRFADFDLSPGRVHSSSSGCWFVWDSIYAADKVIGITNSRIGASGYRDGYFPRGPDETPVIPGFRFVAAEGTRREGFTWIGVWNAEGSVQRSQIIAFGPKRHLVLATLPIRLGAVAHLLDVHSPAIHLTFVGEGKAGSLVPWMRLTWP